MKENQNQGKNFFGDGWLFDGRFEYAYNKGRRGLTERRNIKKRDQ